LYFPYVQFEPTKICSLQWDYIAVLFARRIWRNNTLHTKVVCLALTFFFHSVLEPHALGQRPSKLILFKRFNATPTL